MTPPRVPQTRRYHWYAVLLFIMGTLFPPLAVAARFGIGKDFWLNLLLTIAGYIPGKCHQPSSVPDPHPARIGHVHNFYIQNIRNNKTHQRTPKWALRYGLVSGSTIRRHEQRSQWAGKYNDRNPDSGYEQQPLEDGQVGPSRSLTRPSTDNSPGNGDGLWRPDDESYYSAEREGLHTPGSDGRWRYTPDFNISLPGTGETTRKKKKKDRWARTEDAYTASGQKKRKKKSKNRSTVGDGADADSTHSHHAESTMEPELPEDATRGAYGGRVQGNAQAETENGHATVSQGDEFNHEF